MSKVTVTACSFYIKCTSKIKCFKKASLGLEGRTSHRGAFVGHTVV